MTKNEWWIKYNSFELVTFYFENIKEWWDPVRFDWSLSSELAENCAQYFDIWWDPKKFNWATSSFALARYCYRHIKKWWDENRYNWRGASDYLAAYCYDYFQVWYNINKLNWEEAGTDILQYCKHQFTDAQINELLSHGDALLQDIGRSFEPDVGEQAYREITGGEWSNFNSAELCTHYFYRFKDWFDSKTFNWPDASDYLAAYCHDYFLDWFDPEKYNWELVSWALAMHCFEYFKIWWDPNKYNWKIGSSELAHYCVRYFHIWWDPNLFVWTEESFDSLVNYCSYMFTYEQLKQLLSHPNKDARFFAEEIIKRDYADRDFKSTKREEKKMSIDAEIQKLISSVIKQNENKIDIEYYDDLIIAHDIGNYDNVMAIVTKNNEFTPYFYRKINFNY